MRRAGLVAVVAVLATSELARADEDAVARAEALFQEARARLHDGDWQRACALFEESMRLDASVSTLLKIGRCREQAHALRDALATYQAALDLNEKMGTPERRARLRDWTERAVADVRARLPHLRVVVDPPIPDATILRDGAPLGEDDAVDPGTHVITFRAPGYEGERRDIQVTEGERREVVLVPARAVARSIPSASNRAGTEDRPAAVRVEPAPAPGPPLGAVVLAGLAATSFAVSGVFAVRTAQKLHDSNPLCDTANACTQAGLDLRAEASRAQTVSLLSLAAGVVLAGGAVGVWIATPSRTQHAGAGVAVRW